MSVAHLDVSAPSTDLADAAGRGEHVVLYCLGCARSLKALARTALGVFGAIPFGMLMGKKACRRCRETLWIVLPWYAPTPRDWVKQYKPESLTPPGYIEPPRREFIFQVESIDKDGNIDETRTLTRDLDVATFAFDSAVRKSRKDFDRFHLRNGSLLMRDSARDFKVLPPEGSR